MRQVVFILWVREGVLILLASVDWQKNVAKSAGQYVAGFASGLDD